MRSEAQRRRRLDPGTEFLRTHGLRWDGRANEEIERGQPTFERRIGLNPMGPQPRDRRYPKR